MRPIRTDIDLATVDINGIFEAQQLVGAGDVVLDGTEISGGVWTSPDGFAKQIAIACAGDINTVVFTITGFREANSKVPITDTITGVNANAVESTEYFYSITSIAADAAVGTDIYGGAVDEAITRTIPLNWRGAECGVNVFVTGTINYTVQQTVSDIGSLTNYDYNWQDCDDTALVAATATANTSYVSVPIALRLKVNSYSTGAELAFDIIQRDI